MKKILIIQTAFIGDVILATGLIEKLHNFYPNSKIDFLLRKGNEGLLDNNPYVNNVLIWNKKHNKYKNLYKILKQIRQNNYSLVVNLQRFASSGILTCLSKAKYKTGFKKNPFSFCFDKKTEHQINNGKHEIERNNKLIEHITDNISFKPKLYPSNKDKEFVKQYKSEKYICIAPASVWFTKQLPEQQWINLVNKHLNYKIFLLGGFEDSNKMAVEKLKNKYNIEIKGYSPAYEAYPFSKTNNDKILHKIKNFKPDILFVGFGAPKQDYWIYDNKKFLEDIGIKWAIGSGGTFEFVAGKIKRAPKIIQKVGLEGVWRFIMEPKWFRFKRLLISLKIFRYLWR